MACSFKAMVDKRVEVLPVLTSYASTFAPPDRWDAVAWLFGSKGLLDGQGSDMFLHTFCGFPAEFGHLQFRVQADMFEAQCVLGITNKFLSLVDDGGYLQGGLGAGGR